MSEKRQPNGRRRFLAATALGLPGGLITARDLLVGRMPSLPEPAGTRPDEAYWRAVKRLYPLTPERTYLNTGGLGPAPWPVLDAFSRTTMDLARVSETGHRLIEEARERVAPFFGAHPDEICFTRNATEGNSIIASGLDLRPGDEVLFDAHAHPGGSIPWLSRQKHGDVRVRLFEPDARSADELLERIDSALTSRTRVLQVSHVTAPTGIRLPVERIASMARQRGIWFHIDGAQSAGMFGIDLPAIGCDSWATSGHKWMGAPHGTGILFIRKERLDDVRPTEVGAYSDSAYRLPDALEYVGTARRHESGTRNAALVKGVEEACAFLEQIGMDAVEKRGRELTGRLRSLLADLDRVEVLTPAAADLSGSMLTLRTEGLPYDELNRHLGSVHRLRCRVVTERGLNAVRISMHVFNLLEDCERVAEGVIDALEKLG
ncbi:MAG: aminotransferase class V-fold PLP-dependent enzyme [Rhodothermales bacterium]|nr:aminotransferase class V-fold PLP-dependent enzyme [Rhodothermales bacterium]